MVSVVKWIEADSKSHILKQNNTVSYNGMCWHSVAPSWGALWSDWELSDEDDAEDDGSSRLNVNVSWIGQNLSQSAECHMSTTTSLPVLLLSEFSQSLSVKWCLQPSSAAPPISLLDTSWRMLKWRCCVLGCRVQTADWKSQVSCCPLVVDSVETHRPPTLCLVQEC